MQSEDDSLAGRRNQYFPTTHWSKLEVVKGDITPEHKAALNFLIHQYWRPIYIYIKYKGFAKEEAEDLTQEFFTVWLIKRIFGRADPKRGRFRSFLLKSLNNFLSNINRSERAQKRKPIKGFISIHELRVDRQDFPVKRNSDNPEEVFFKAWNIDLIFRVLKIFKKECGVTGKDKHYEIFKRRIIKPVLEGSNIPPMHVLSEKLNLTEKQAANHLLTARRAYQRLLREEIRTYAHSDEEVAEEISDLFSFFSE